MPELPTPRDVVTVADAHLRTALLYLSAARDELKSDTRREWTPVLAERKRRMFEAITAAKAAIEQARHG